MKEILQTSVLNFESICFVPYTHASISFHVDNVAKDPQEIAEAEPEAEFQEQQPEQEFEVEEPELDQELTDFFNTQGKHRFI